METKRLHMMVCEIFKTLNNLNPVFMKDIFHYSPNVTHKKHNLYIHTQNATKFGNKSLRAFGANIWNTFPEYIKSTSSLLEFKQFLTKVKYTLSIFQIYWKYTSKVYLKHTPSILEAYFKYTASILEVYFKYTST